MPTTSTNTCRSGILPDSWSRRDDISFSLQRSDMSIEGDRSNPRAPEERNVYRIGLIHDKLIESLYFRYKILYPLRSAIKKRSVCRHIKGEKGFTPLRDLLCKLQRLTTFRGVGDTYLVRECCNKCVALICQPCR